MALVELTAQVRHETGKGAAHRIRRDGKLPAIVYGPGQKNVMIAVETRELDKLLRSTAGRSFLIDLKLTGEGAQDLKVLMKEIQRDPVTARPMHLDLLSVSMDRPVQMVVPIHFTGVPVGVRLSGGFLDLVLRNLEVECLPAEIPDFIEVDVTKLDVGDSIHAAELAKEGVTIVTPGDRVIAAVHGKTAANVAEEAAEAAAEEAAESAPAEGAQAEATDK
jgi:large subunit ribosomal protein L25